MEKFIQNIKYEVMQLYATFLKQPTAELTDRLKRGGEAAEKCPFCLKAFNNSEFRKVRDHYYYLGLYRGEAHINCNIRYRIPEDIPNVFHNLRGYHAHLFIEELGSLRGMILGLLQQSWVS